jgi:hypothetical protein
LHTIPLVRWLYLHDELACGWWFRNHSARVTLDVYRQGCFVCCHITKGKLAFIRRYWPDCFNSGNTELGNSLL